MLFESRPKLLTHILLSQVFGEHSEGLNFRRNVASLLGVPGTASCAKLIQVVTERLSADGEEGDAMFQPL